MPTADPRIDAYIRKAPAFARPILEQLRGVIHEGCPEVVESMKWSMPAFDYHGPLCGLAAFKAHCAFRFWKGELVAPQAAGGAARGTFGHIESLDELPPRRTLVAMVRKASRLNVDGVRAPWQEQRAKSRTTRASAPVAVPDDLRAALQKNPRASAAFAAFSPSHRREYVDWIVGAKREETRVRRIALAITQIAEGKSQNWKYERK
jgi:hypothetical protein